MLLQTDVLQKTVVWCPWVYAILYCPFPCRDGRALGAGGGEGNFSRGKMFLFNTLSKLSFFREICHWECWKYHFRASTFQKEAPGPLPQQTRISRASFQASPPTQLKLCSAIPAMQCMYNLFALQILHKLLDCIKLFPFKNNNLLSLQVPKVNWKMLIFSQTFTVPSFFASLSGLSSLQGQPSWFHMSLEHWHQGL